MKNIEDLIQKAVELQNNGLGTGQIADELNVSRETVTWLLTRSKKKSHPAPKDISVNWSSIGKSATRLHYISLALCDMVIETLEKTNTEVDVVVGVAASGIPLASMMANELGVDLPFTIPVKAGHGPARPERHHQQELRKRCRQKLCNR